MLEYTNLFGRDAEETRLTSACFRMSSRQCYLTKHVCAPMRLVIKRLLDDVAIFGKLGQEHCDSCLSIGTCGWMLVPGTWLVTRQFRILVALEIVGYLAP